MKTYNDSPLLGEWQKGIFHSIVQKLLHVSKRARLNLQVTIDFLCTRVTMPNKEDWKKLKRLLQYIYGTLKIKRVISLDLYKQMNIFIDASHTCHENIRGQTGGCISMGKGVLHAQSSKQTLNSISSTET